MTMSPPTPIERRAWPATRRELDRLVRRRTPAIFTGALAGCAALDRWSLDFFAREHGAVAVRAQLLSAAGYRSLRTATMTLAECVARMRDESEIAAPYVGGWSFTRELPSGDVLFIPGGHRHQLRSLDESVSVSTFWEHHLAQRLLRRALALVGRGTS